MIENWRMLAGCRGKSWEIFFPFGVPGSKGYQAMEDIALEACEGCPVRMDCLGEAIADEVVDGVLGGMGEVERRGLIIMLRVANRRARAEEKAREAAEKISA